jgi:hypothetical protein
MTPIESAPRLTELQFQIINAMMDDAEDIERIYLAINWKAIEAGSIQPEHSLSQIIDELSPLLRSGYVEAPKYCNPSLPLPPNISLLHHYWFGPTEKGKQAWEAYKVS